MELTPRRPWGEVSRLRREMDDLWNRFFGETPLRRGGLAEWIPTVDISEAADKIVVRAELPGMEAKDIDISVSGDTLTIKGEKKEEHEKKEESYYSSERYFGSFQRSFQLPSNVVSDKVDATFKNGILTINLPKSEETKAKKIEVKTG